MRRLLLLLAVLAVPATAQAATEYRGGWNNPEPVGQGGTTDIKGVRFDLARADYSYVVASGASAAGWVGVAKNWSNGNRKYLVKVGYTKVNRSGDWCGGPYNNMKVFAETRFYDSAGNLIENATICDVGQDVTGSETHTLKLQRCGSGTNDNWCAYVDGSQLGSSCSIGACGTFDQGDSVLSGASCEENASGCFASGPFEYRLDLSGSGQDMEVTENGTYSGSITWYCVANQDGEVNGGGLFNSIPNWSGCNTDYTVKRS